MWRFPIAAGGVIAGLMVTSAPFAHDTVRAKAIAAAIVIAPFAVLALWLKRRGRPKATAQTARPGYSFSVVPPVNRRRSR